jgi:dihydrofolate synthase / folylpolyglutamate synthase
MTVTAVKSRIVETSTCTIEELLNESLHSLSDGTVVAVSSKVVSLCEGATVPMDGTDKDALVTSEADLYLPKQENRFNIYLTIKNSMLTPSAGVDESNTNGHFVLWPENPQQSACRIWHYLRERFGLGRLGVVITDSAPSPLRWGVTGRAVAYCGFKGLNSKVGQSDLFGRELTMTSVNIADALAASAVLCMGEADEQTPLALITDLPFVTFSETEPTAEELESMRVSMEEDLYGQLLSSVRWRGTEK